MGYIIGIASLFVALLTYKMNRNLLEPTCFFGIIWGIICIGSQMRLFGFTGADTYCYVLIGIGILCFFIGSSFFIDKQQVISFEIGQVQRKKTSNSVNTTLLWVMLIIIFVYTCWKFVLALPYIMMNNSLGYVRTIYLQVGGGITLNAFDYLINTFIIAGFRLTCEVIIINELIARRKVGRLMLCFLAVIIGMNVLLSGGRMILLDFGMYVVFSILLNGFKVKIKLSAWQKIAILCGGAVVIFAMIYITKDRQGNISVVESVYGNFFGGVSLFNTIVHDVLENNWTWGVMFGYAVISILWIPLNYILGIPYPEAFSTYDLLISPFYSVGNTTMNAYTTCWLFFYSDFRIPGLIMFSIIFGIIAGNSYRRFEMTRSGSDTCIYMIMLNVMVYSIIRWQLCNSSYVLAIVLIPFIYKSCSKKTEK